MLKVIKIGGKLIENDSILSCLCDKLSACYPDCVLVHGGGEHGRTIVFPFGNRNAYV